MELIDFKALNPGLEKYEVNFVRKLVFSSIPREEIWLVFHLSENEKDVEIVKDILIKFDQDIIYVDENNEQKVDCTGHEEGVEDNEISNAACIKILLNQLSKDGCPLPTIVKARIEGDYAFKIFSFPFFTPTLKKR
jgi:hypothetical protein